jgi:hypothetical protein
MLSSLMQQPEVTDLSWATCSLSFPIASSVATLPFKNSSGHTPGVTGVALSALPPPLLLRGLNAAPCSWILLQKVQTSSPLWGRAVLQQ